MQTLTEHRPLAVAFTSTGEKLFFHQEAMARLRNGFGTPISSWCAPTDFCNARCSYCSVQERVGSVLPFRIVKGFIDQLVPLGLKSITYSGGGNFLLYKCPETGKDCNDLVDYSHDQGLQVALITNGLPLKEFPGGRRSWKTMRPETLDKLTWVRVSMPGLDHNHKEQVVYVPDFDRSKSDLGFSWIMADSFEEPGHKHGWVSTVGDVRTEMENRRIVLAEDRLPWIEEQIGNYVETYKPIYTRLLCDCLRPDLIPKRHATLSGMADRINERVGKSIAFSQAKPPRQPVKNCAKVYTRPCLNSDAFVFCCDSVVLNQRAGHKFGEDWRVCRWDEVGKLFSEKIRQVIPNTICPGCVFPEQVDLIGEVIEGRETPVPEGVPPAHLAFV